MKLLAIDDNQDNLTSLQAVVHDVLPECTVITARSGQQGLKLAAAEDPDVILLDIVMPEMDGFEVCRRLKADPDLRSIPVVFLTALRTDRESQARALAAGGDAFLTKPLNEQELIAQIRAMVRLKMAARFQMLDKEQLSTLVAERTMALEHELIERRQAQQAAEQAAQEWQATFDASNDAIWILDASQRVLRANKTSEKFFSRPCSSILGQQCWSVVHGANAPHSDCPLVRAHRTGHRETLEFQDGNRWLEVKVDPIMLADGHYHGAVHT
ncbi:MAG: response regulator, partial [bacterium]